MFALNKLPMWNRLLHQFNIESFKKVTCNGFFISIYAIDNNFDETKTLKFLKKIGLMKLKELRT